MPNVCGQVVDAATGAPVAQFSAQLRGFTDVQTPTAPLPETEAAFSDGGGNFCLEGVEQGRYVVEAWAPGYAPSRSENFVVSSDHNAEHVAVKLTRGGMISGRIVDSANRPVAKALLRTRPVDWGEDEFTSSIDDIFPSHATRVETRTDANGSFTLKGLSPDDYQVLIDASGFARSSKNNLTVTEGATTPMGDVRLERGGTLVGTVYDGTGKGVAGAGITLDSADSATPREYRTKSGIDGKFTLRNIAQGRYRARPSAPAGPEPNPLEDLRIGADAERQITIADEQESKIELILPASAPPPDVQPMPEEAPVKPSPENRPPVKRP
jgi:protocatechuate 3,4-dioxygenase beta subunit